jgi:hypothetical protein
MSVVTLRLFLLHFSLSMLINVEYYPLDVLGVR